MVEPTEIELKLICDTSDLATLRSWPRLAKAAPGRTDTLESAYFDTQGQLLRRNGYVLRVRRTHNGYVQTVKAEGDGLIERPEWEHPVAGPEPDRSALATTPLAALLDGGTGLAALFGVSVERTVHLVKQGRSRIEVALDHGRIARPDARLRADTEFVSEVELELKQGEIADLFALAEEIGRLIPLRLGVQSKSERGFDLIDGDRERARKAEPVRLSDSMSAADAFRVIAHSCLRHLRLNEEILLDHRDPDALHQMRVALRRLRSALSLFQGLLADERFAGVKAQLKQLSEPLGHVRNLDVLLAETLPAERARQPDETALLDLETRLECQRMAAYAELQSRLRSDEWRHGFIDLVAWINAGPWLSTGDAAVRDQPVRALAAQVLDRRRRQVTRRGRHLSDLSPEQRHRVRIAAKKLRYGAEFFAGLYAGKKRRKRQKLFLSALSDLQDSLGTLNDLSSGRALLAGLAAVESGSLPLLDIDLAGPAAAKREKKLLAAAAKARRALKKAQPFWR